MLFVVLVVSTFQAKEVSTQKLHRFEDSRVSMACTYTVVVYGTDPKQLPLITTAALDEVDRIDALMSNYKPESPLSQINREAGEHPVPGRAGAISLSGALCSLQPAI